MLYYKRFSNTVSTCQEAVNQCSKIVKLSSSGKINITYVSGKGNEHIFAARTDKGNNNSYFAQACQLFFSIRLTVLIMVLELVNVS